MSSLNYLFVLCLLIAVSQQKNLPDFIKRCKYTEDANALGACITDVFNDNRDKFMNGVPEMHVPPLDPFTLPRIDFNTGNGAVIGVNAVFTNLKIIGAKNAKIEKLVVDIPNRKVMLEITIPELSIMGDYQLDGRILVIQLNGTGKGEGNFTNIHAINNYDGEAVTKNGKEYVKWKKSTLDIAIEGIHVNFDNLFNGNKELTETTNQAINENAQEILKELKPLAEETISSIIYGIMNEVFKTFSTEELFEH